MLTLEEYNRFIEESANDLLKSLSKEDKEALQKAPDYATQHFGLGLYIRNKYVHGRSADDALPFRADTVSHMIYDRMIEKLQM